MQRIKTISINSTQGKGKELLEMSQKAMGGKLLNIFAAMANSPAALDSYLNQMTALAKGRLSPALREQIALTVAGENSCTYCASAHTYLGEKTGITKNELTSNLKGHSADHKTQEGLKFATQLVTERGHVSENDIQAARAAGYTDEELVEIVAHVAMNTFTNYFNEAFKTEVDFPVVKPEAWLKSA